VIARDRKSEPDNAASNATAGGQVGLCFLIAGDDGDRGDHPMILPLAKTRGAWYKR
jgi:hypothetical protein